MTNNTQKPRRGRPRKVARENSDTRALLIRSGVAVLTENGFVAASIDSILKQVGVPKGSFYHYFKSKEDFGVTVINSYASYFAARLDKCLLDETLPPLARIRTFAEGAKAGLRKYQFKRGCLVGNLGQEVAILPESYRAMLLDIFAVWQHKIATCLLTAQANGDLASHIDCEQMAECFWIGWEGAVMRARLMQSVQPLDLYIDIFMANLTHSSPHFPQQ